MSFRTTPLSVHVRDHLLVLLKKATSWYTIIFREHFVSSHVIITVVSAVVILLTAWIMGRRRSARVFPTIALGTIALSFAMATSFRVFAPSATSTDGLGLFLDPSLLFIVQVSIKLFLLTWIVVLVKTLFNPERIRKISAKLPGIQLEHEIAPEEAKQAKTNMEQIANEFKLLASLNQEALEYLLQPFERNVLSAQDPSERIRQIVTDAMTHVYQAFPQTGMWVIPDSEPEIQALGLKYAAEIRRVYRQDVNVVRTTTNSIGVAILHDDQKTGTIIIIDAVDREILQAEIYWAAAFFVALTSSIESMQAREQANTDRRGVQ